MSAQSATTGTSAVGSDAGTAAVELAIGGMTCASCAARIEKKLNRMDGVEATVNYATEKAKVTYQGSEVSVDDLIATVEATGYTARRPAPPADPAAARRTPRHGARTARTARRARTPRRALRTRGSPRCASA